MRQSTFTFPWSACVCWACDHVVQAMMGPLAIRFSMCRNCHKLIRSHHTHLRSIADRSRIRLPALPIQESGVHLSIGVHTQNHSASAWDLANDSVHFAPEFKSKRLRCHCLRSLIMHWCIRADDVHILRTAALSPRIRPGIQWCTHLI